MFGFVTLNADLVITQWSEYLATLTGVHPSQAVGKNLFQLFPDLRERGIDVAIQHVFETGAPLSLSRIFHQYVFPAKDGTLVEQSALIHPLIQANQVIGVILNIQDVSDRTQLEMELINRLRLFEALHSIDQFSMAENLEAALQLTVEAATSLLQVNFCNLCLIEGQCRRYASSPETLNPSWDCSQCGICAEIQTTAQPLRIFNPATNPIVPPVYARAGALAAVPLKGNNQVLGTLVVGAESPSQIMGDALGMLAPLADAAASAIISNRAHRQERQRMRELEILHLVSLQLRSVNSVGEVLQRSLEQAILLVEATGGMVLVPSKDGQFLEVAQIKNLPEAARQMRLSMEGSVAGKVFCSPEPASFILNDCLQINDYILSDAMQEIARTFPSWMYAPLNANGAPLGVLAVCAAEPHKFSNEMLKPFGTLTEIVAVAAQRMINLEKANQRSHQLALLNELSKRLSATQGIQEVYSMVVQSLVNDFGYALAVVTERDAPTQKLILRAIQSQSKLEFPPGTRIPYGIGITSTVFDSGQSLILNRVADDPRYFKIGDFSAGSQLSVPVMVDGITTAVITVEQPEVNAFDSSDLDVIQVMAAHLGVAVSNIRRHQNLSTLASRLQVFDQAIHQITSRPDTGSILQTLLEASATLVPFERGGVFLVDEARLALMPVAFKG